MSEFHSRSASLTPDSLSPDPEELEDRKDTSENGGSVDVDEDIDDCSWVEAGGL